MQLNCLGIFHPLLSSSSLSFLKMLVSLSKILSALLDGIDYKKYNLAVT